MKPVYSLLLWLGFVALLGHAATSTGEAQAEQQPFPQAILNALSDVQATLSNIPPAWSQLLPVAERFVPALGGAAALDKETGLVWELTPAPSPSPTLGVPWHTAVTFCHRRVVGNRKGWRLPTLQELLSLVDPTQEGVALPVGHPFQNVQRNFYWSATANVSSPTDAMAVNMGSAGNASSFHKLDSNVNDVFPLMMWCVRGGHGGPEAQ